MNNITSTVVAGVVLSLISGGVGLIWTLNNDVNALKIHAHATDESLRERGVEAKEFIKVMNNINVTLSAQTEAITNLKEAVRRIEGLAPVSYVARYDLEDVE